MKIPFLNIAEQYKRLRHEIEPKLLNLLSSGEYILGPYTQALEEKFKEYHDISNAVGLASGTDAILLSLRAAQLNFGDDVIVPAYTFISSVSTVCYSGAKPVFADIDLQNYGLTINNILAVLTPRTRAIILVYLYGQMMDIKPIIEFCQKKNLILIEDVAQALGAEYENKKAGSFGFTGCFSFYPTKILNAAGDGGMVITQSNKSGRFIRQLRDHGQSAKYQFHHLGYNSRLDEIQALILSVKFQYIEKWIQKRRQLAKSYLNRLSQIPGIICPTELPNTRHVYNLFTIRVPQRNKLRNYLTQKGIGTAIHYPNPLHIQKAFSFLKYRKGDFPNSEFAAQSVLSLPLYPEMPDNYIDEICELIGKYYGNSI